MSAPVLWAKLSWPELEALAARPPHMVIWPMGTIEQHGKHLPVDVDVRNCWEIACGVSARTGVPLIPALPYGDSRHWEATRQDPERCDDLPVEPRAVPDVRAQVRRAARARGRSHRRDRAGLDGSHGGN